MDVEGTEALLQELSPPRRRGRKSVHNWTDIVDRALLTLQRIGSPLLKNFSALEPYLLAHLKQEIGHSFKSTKRFREQIRAFPGVQN